MSQRAVRTVLIEPDSLLREGLSALLKRIPALQLIGAVPDPIGCAELSGQLKPQLLVTELQRASRPDLSWLPAWRELVPDLRVLVLTASCTDECIRCALAAGVHGYVLKDSSREELLQAIAAVAAGVRHLSAAVSARMLARYLEPVALARSGGKLTARECEILRQIAQGTSNRRVADSLGISIKTVEKHRARLMRKLDLGDVEQLRRRAVRDGLLAPQTFETM